MRPISNSINMHVRMVCWSNRGGRAGVNDIYESRARVGSGLTCAAGIVRKLSYGHIDPYNPDVT